MHTVNSINLYSYNLLAKLSKRQLLGGIDKNRLKLREKCQVNYTIVSDVLKFLVNTLPNRIRGGICVNGSTFFRITREQLSREFDKSVNHMGKVLALLVNKNLIIRKRLRAGYRDTTYYYALNEKGLLSFLNISADDLMSPETDQPTNESDSTFVLRIHNTSLNSSMDFDRNVGVSGIQNTDRLSGDVPPCYAPNTGLQGKVYDVTESSTRGSHYIDSSQRCYAADDHSVEALASVITAETGLKFEGTQKGLQEFYRHVRAAFQSDMFRRHKESWVLYWRKVWESDCLMGRNGGFKAQLGWLLRFQVIDRILKGFNSLRDFLEKDARAKCRKAWKQQAAGFEEKGKDTEDSDIFRDETVSDRYEDTYTRKERTYSKSSNNSNAYEPNTCASWGGRAKLGAEYSFLKRNYSWESEDAPPQETKYDKPKVHEVKPQVREANMSRDENIIYLPFTSSLPIHDPIVEWDIPCDPIIEYEEFDI